ncbi:MAG: exosortase system-associated protein, TIGR04073 family [Verrucomicrobiales bacterium]|nr:exosortase system-associated protein, TIGR04073 family [Verrucomicrobiales bacterium]
MKKVVLTLLVASLGTWAVADIQSPPGASNGAIKKLGRAVSNLIYGATEIPATWSRTLDSEGSNSAATYGVLKGVEKTVVRVGYGLYELVTFPAPTYKQGYKTPYYKKADISPQLGYGDYPPQLGMISNSKYTRDQTY